LLAVSFPISPTRQSKAARFRYELDIKYGAVILGSSKEKRVVSHEAPFPPQQALARQTRRSAGSGSAFTDVDLGAHGKQVGFLYIPQSPHDDAWGTIRIPVAVIANGAGPTILIEAGNHGDEYEGPIALGDIIRTLDPTAVKGRIIALPAVNAPAVLAAQRTSPLDGLNFNRAFPGSATGTITNQIAAYVHDVLFAEADYFLDLHSGGSSLRIMPSAIIEPNRDPALHKRNVAATLAFGAPIVVEVDNLGEPRTATAAANAAGLIVIGTEMAGGGTVTRAALDLCRCGIRNVLAHIGITDPATLTKPASPRIYAVPGPAAYVLASEDGVFEPLHDLGEPVQAGMTAGYIHFVADPTRAPVPLHYQADGIVYALRQPARVKPGNCCAVVAAPHDPGVCR
jgi:predicted deacylase